MRDVVIRHAAEFYRFCDAERLNAIGAEELGESRELLTLQKLSAKSPIADPTGSRPKVTKGEFELPVPHQPKSWPIVQVLVINAVIISAILECVWHRRRHRKHWVTCGGVNHPVRLSS